MNDRVLTYVLFDGDWERVVGNRQNRVSHQLHEEEDVLPIYLEYLEGSVRSLAATCGENRPRIRIWLIQIEGRLRPRELRARLTAAAPGFDLDIAIADPSFVRRFLDQAYAAPKGHRTPNTLHEATFFLALRDSPERFVFFADTDLTFIAPDAFNRFVDSLAAAPGKLAAGFIEPAVRPWLGPHEPPGRERLHTVACAFDAEAMRREFPILLFTEPTSLQIRSLALRDPAAVAHYCQNGRIDSLSLFTDWARTPGLPDRILSMNDRMAHYAERGKLTIVCEDMVHCKYLWAGASDLLEEALAAAGTPRTPLLEHILSKARQTKGNGQRI